ncbi:FAD binding domain-containing protein [bacterium]|nr:FAD binding domain-containing protein [bacterium]
MNFKVISPRTIKELLGVITSQQGAQFRFGAGYSDLLLELKKQPIEDLTVINLAYLTDTQINSIEVLGDGIKIGVQVTAHALMSDVNIRTNYPVLYEAASQLASRQIRQVATVGGNLCTASPAGDLGCALVALKAQCEILSAQGTIRTISLEDFFLGVRKTVLQGHELLYSVFVPANDEGKEICSHFIKIGTRNAMEIAIVSLAYHFQLSDDKITSAGAAIGSVAPVIKFVGEACEFLKGKSFSNVSPKTASEFAAKVGSYASPISDIRASDWYRSEVLYNISKSIFEKSLE